MREQPCGGTRKPKAGFDPLKELNCKVKFQLAELPAGN